MVYKHAFAGAIVNDENDPTPHQTRWSKLREENIKLYGGNPWGRWGTKAEWEDAKWMATTKVSRGSLDTL